MTNNIIALLKVADSLIGNKLLKELSTENTGSNRYLITAQADISKAIEAIEDWEQDNEPRG